MIYTISVGKKKRVLHADSLQDLLNLVVKKYIHSFSQGKVFLVSSNDPDIPFGTYRFEQIGMYNGTIIRPTSSETRKYEL